MAQRIFSNTLAFLPAAALIAMTAPALAHGSSHKSEPLVLKKVGSFFVGGRDLDVSYRSNNFISSTYELPDVVRVDQMYVSYMLPEAKKHKVGVVFVHGAWHTGKTWEETPDGRDGWAVYFTRKGFDTYWVDKPWRGKAAFNADRLNQAARGDAATQPTIYITGHQGWTGFRIGPSVGVLNPGGKFPLAAAEQYFDQLVPDFSVELRGGPALQSYPELNADMGELFDKVKPAVYIGHSQGGFELAGIFETNPDKIAGAIAVEGSCPPVADAQLYKDNNVPFLSVYGDYTTPPTVCQDFVDALNAIGGNGTNLSLPAIGITGNDHMMMLDTNSDQVAQVLVDWIEKNVERKRHQHHSHRH